MVMRDIFESFKGKDGTPVKMRVISCFDSEEFAGQQFGQLFDLNVGKDESDQIPAGSLTGKVVEIGIREFNIRMGGKLVARGSIPPQMIASLKANGEGKK